MQGANYTPWPPLLGGESAFKRQYVEPKYPEVRVRCLKRFMLNGKVVPSLEEACRPDNPGGFMPGDATVTIPQPLADDLVARGRAEIIA